MNKTQKGALYGLLLSASLAAIAVFDAYESIMTTTTKMTVGVAWFALLVLPPFLLSRKRPGTEVETDERDKLIIRRSIIIAFCLVCGLLILASTATLFVLEGPVSIPFARLAGIIYGSFIVFISILSIVILIQYGRRARGDDYE